MKPYINIINFLFIAILLFVISCQNDDDVNDDDVNKMLAVSTSMKNKISLGDISVEQVETTEGDPINFEVNLSKSVKGGTTLMMIIKNQYIDYEDFLINEIKYSINGGYSWNKGSVPIIRIYVPEREKTIKISIPTVDDELVEGKETFFVSFIGNGDLNINNDAILMSLNDNDSKKVNLKNSAIAQYRITDDNKLIIQSTISELESFNQKKYLDDKAKHHEMWETVKELVPEEWVSRLVGFEIIYDSMVLGYVYPASRNRLDKWVLGLSVNYAYGSSSKYVEKGWFNYIGLLAQTIVHEFGHIITLNETQVNKSTSRWKCQTFYNNVERGCFNSNSYLYGFYKDFWSSTSRGQPYLNFHDSALDEFYSEHKSDFVSEYASVNYAEDIAETIRHFSAQNTINSSTESSTFALQKLNYIKEFSLFRKLKVFFRSSGVDIGQVTEKRNLNNRNLNNRKKINWQEQSCLDVENNWN